MQFYSEILDMQLVFFLLHKSVGFHGSFKKNSLQLFPPASNLKYFARKKGKMPF